MHISFRNKHGRFCIETFNFPKFSQSMMYCCRKNLIFTSRFNVAYKSFKMTLQYIQVCVFHSLCHFYTFHNIWKQSFEVLPAMETVHHILYLKCQSLLSTNSFKSHRYFGFKTLLHYHRNDSFHKEITSTWGTKI